MTAVLRGVFLYCTGIRRPCRTSLLKGDLLKGKYVTSDGVVGTSHFISAGCGVMGDAFGFGILLTMSDGVLQKFHRRRFFESFNFGGKRKMSRSFEKNYH